MQLVSAYQYLIVCMKLILYAVVEKESVSFPIKSFQNSKICFQSYGAKAIPEVSGQATADAVAKNGVFETGWCTPLPSKTIKNLTKS